MATPQSNTDFFSNPFIKTPDDPIDKKRMEMVSLMMKATKIRTKYEKPDYTRIPGPTTQETIHFEEIYPTDFMKEIEDFLERLYQDMDYWFEHILHKDILKEFSDSPMWQWNMCFLSFWFLEFLCGILLYQRRVGGNKIADGLNKTIPIGDRSLDLCLQLLTLL